METRTFFGDAGSDDADIVLFAVPKKGRLHEEAMKLLNGAGLDAKRPDRLDVAMCKELPVKLVFLPAADIPSYVMEGNVDMGISGSDVLEETIVEAGFEESPPVKVLTKLGFGKCRLCVQAPKVLNCTDSKLFAGKRIVTSFPNLARRHFKKHDEELGTSTTIKVVSGSVEAACGLGLAEAIVDIVETGTTMHAAGLEIVTPIFTSEALLFQQALRSGSNAEGSTNGAFQPPARVSAKKKELMELIKCRIDGYLTATRYVMVVYNCHDDKLSACCDLTPGKRSPTITELKSEGWHSVSALVEKSKIHKIMDELTAAGAVDILCFNCTNTRM